MFNTLLELIFAVESQDLIADVTRLEDKFNKVLNSIENLPHKEQQQIVAHIYTVVYTKQKYPAKCWYNIAELKDYFFALTHQHKIARAKDAGEKILHAMHKVLLLETLEEFSAMQIKYATNHDKHARDVKASGAIEGVGPAFLTEVVHIDETLTETIQTADEQIKQYTMELNRLIEAKSIASKQGEHDAGKSGEIQREIDKFKTELEELTAAKNKLNTSTIELSGDKPEPDKLNMAFVDLVALRRKSLALTAKATLASVQEAATQAEAKANEAKREKKEAEERAAREAAAALVKQTIVDEFRKFVNITDSPGGLITGQDEAGKGLVGALNIERRSLDAAIARLTEITEIPLKNKTEAEIIAAVKAMHIANGDAVMLQVSTDKLIVAATDITKQKAVVRAQLAGAAIAAAFGTVLTTNAGGLDALLTEYKNNHNMHALNVLEHTVEGDELREIMFTAMEKALPFERNMVRNLDLLQQKIAEIVQARIV